MAPRKTREQRLAELEAEREALLAADDDDDDGVEYWVKRGENEFAAPAKSRAGKAVAGFLKESFGIDLSGEPVQDPDDGDGDDDDGKAKGKRKPPAAGDGKPAQVVRFGRARDAS